jgi:hypothetical protein
LADTAVLRVDVASADFDKFHKAFQQYSQTLQQTLFVWKQITTEVKAASVAMSGMATPISKQTASLQKITSQWAEQAKHATTVRTNVDSITKGIVSWRTAMTSTLALLGLGGGLYGLTSLVRGGVDALAQSRAAGVGYGQARAFANLPGGRAFEQGWGQARWDPRSGAYIGAQTLYGPRTDQQLARTDPKAMIDTLNRAQEYLSQFDEKIRGAVAASTHLNDFIGTDLLRIWQDMTAKEKAVATVAMEASGKAADAAKNAIEGWNTFQLVLDNTRSAIEDNLLNKLSPLSEPLTHLSLSINNALDQLLNSKAVGDAIRDAATQIDEWAKALDSPEGRQAIKDFGTEIGQAYQQIKTFVTNVAAVLNDIQTAQQEFGNMMKGFYQWIDSWFKPSENEQSKAQVKGQANPIPWGKIGHDILHPFKSAPFAPDSLEGAPARPQQEQMAPGLLGNNDWVKGWFTQETQKTAAATRAAEQRDETTRTLMQKLTDWFTRAGSREAQLEKTMSDLQARIDASGGGYGPSSGLGWGSNKTIDAIKDWLRMKIAGDISTEAMVGGSGGGGGSGSWGGRGFAVGRARGVGGGGGVGRGDITGATETASSGAGMNARAMSLMNYLVKTRHWTPAAAAIAAGNAEQESGIQSAGAMGDPNTVGSGERGSWGMFQWNRARLHELKTKYGDQWRTDKAQYEYFADEAERMIPNWKSQTDLSHAGSISHAYEGYGDLSTGTRVGNAMRYLRLYGQGDSAVANSTSNIRGPGGGNAGDAQALLAEVKAKNPHLTNEQCVTLVKEFSGMGGSVKDWRRGQSVMAGNLKVGTPIATFMSSSGAQSERYDAGGIGTPGASTSHAALFGGYVRGASGEITGMNVVEQYAGSRPHTKFYPTSGYGEHGAENYYAIRSASRGGRQYAGLGGAGGTAGPLDPDNWHQKPQPMVTLRNQTGGDVNINASTVMQSV